MKKLLPLALLVITSACTTSGPTNNSNTATPALSASATPSGPAAVPYSLTLEGFSIAGFPGLHSSVVAGTPEKLLVFGGRRNGLHGFPGGHDAGKGPAFPKTEANDTAYVLDLKSRKVLGSAQVNTLPVKVANQFKATNTQYELLNGWLYVIGGYGADAQKGTLTTLGYVTVVNFDALVNAIINQQPLDNQFAATNIVQFDHLALAITGGDLELLPDSSGATMFVLAFGQQYDGEYTPGGGLVNQNYSDGVRLFRFDFPAGSTKPSKLNFVASVPNPPGTQMDPENQFHRRDLTVKASVDSTGKRRLVAYGGVFKGGRFEGFLNPVFINSGTNTVTLTANTNTSQLMSQYDTAAIQLFDDRGGAGVIYTTFFGGISQYYWDAATNSLKRDTLDLSKGVDGLPFINSISTLKMPTGTDVGVQYLHVGQTFAPSAAIPTCSTGTGTTAAPLGGAESKFVIASDVKQVTPGVLQLSLITSVSVAGYLVGGIAATVPYSSNGPTCASNMLYQVTINPTQPTNTVQLQLPAGQ